VAGVAKAEPDLKTQSFTITAKPNATVSVKALWEAAEKGKEKVVKVVAPGGTFTTKPQS
jgi:hypothetical protein